MSLNESKKKIGELLVQAGFSLKEVKGVDIFAQKDLDSIGEDFKVVCICKHEHTEDELRKLIFEWIRKKKELGVNKVMFIIDGLMPLGEDLLMAENNDIIIWDKDSVIDNLNDKDKIPKLIGELGIEPYFDKDRDYLTPGASN